MTSHFDNQCREDWLESFQPPLSAHITFTPLTVSIPPSLAVARVLSAASTVRFPRLQSPSAYPSSSFIHHITHRVSLWLTLVLHLSALVPYIISINESTLGFLFSFYCEDVVYQSFSPSLSLHRLPSPDWFCCSEYTELLWCRADFHGRDNWQ